MTENNIQLPVQHLHLEALLHSAQPNKSIGIPQVLNAFKADDPQGYSSFINFMHRLDATLDPTIEHAIMKESAIKTLTSMQLATLALESGLTDFAMLSQQELSLNKSPEGILRTLEGIFSRYHQYVQQAGGVESLYQKEQIAGTREATFEQERTMVQKITFLNLKDHLSMDARAGVEDMRQKLHLHDLDAQKMPNESSLDSKVAQLSTQIAQIASPTPSTVVSEPNYEHQRVVLSQKQEIARS